MRRTNPAEKKKVYCAPAFTLWPAKQIPACPFYVLKKYLPPYAACFVVFFSSCINVSFQLTGGIVMALEKRIEALKKKHADIDQQLREKSLSMGEDSLVLSRLKALKLGIKDEIERLVRDQSIAA